MRLKKELMAGMGCRWTRANATGLEAMGARSWWEWNGDGAGVGEGVGGCAGPGRRKERRATWRPAELGRVKDAIHAQRLGRLAR
jgi:hypothetical protein